MLLLYTSVAIATLTLSQQSNYSSSKVAPTTCVLLTADTYSSLYSMARKFARWQNGCPVCSTLLLPVYQLDVSAALPNTVLDGI